MEGYYAMRSILIAAGIGLIIGSQPMASEPADIAKLMAGEACRFCDLSGASLARQQFPKASLGRANLRESDLKGTNLAGTDLGGADLRRANL